jgi:hypothetical protein
MAARRSARPDWLALELVQRQIERRRKDQIAIVPILRWEEP